MDGAETFSWSVVVGSDAVGVRMARGEAGAGGFGGAARGSGGFGRDGLRGSGFGRNRSGSS